MKILFRNLKCGDEKFYRRNSANIQKHEKFCFLIDIIQRQGSSIIIIVYIFLKKSLRRPLFLVKKIFTPFLVEKGLRPLYFSPKKSHPTFLIEKFIFRKKNQPLLFYSKTSREYTRTTVRCMHLF